MDALLLLSHRPASPLAEFVSSLWALSDSPQHAMERIVPSGTIEIVIDLTSEEIRIYNPLGLDVQARFSGAIVSGAYSRCFVIDTRQHASIIGVHFKPGGAYPFLGVSAAELADSHVDLRALWGSSADELRERLCLASAPGDRFRILERALTAHLFRPLVYHPKVALALRAFGRAEIGQGEIEPNVGEIARCAGLSHRRFVEVFTTAVGMTPKLFGRVRRFQRAVALLRTATHPRWPQIALACGYFDQSHLIRDFRAFSGLSPTDYVRQQSAGVKEDHMPIPGGASLPDPLGC